MALFYIIHNLSRPIFLLVPSADSRSFCAFTSDRLTVKLGQFGATAGV